MFARTERSLLRPGWAEDAPALACAIADEAIVRNLSTAPWPFALRDAEAFLAAPRDPVLPAFLRPLGRGGQRCLWRGWGGGLPIRANFASTLSAPPGPTGRENGAQG